MKPNHNMQTPTVMSADSFQKAHSRRTSRASNVVFKPVFISKDEYLCQPAPHFHSPHLDRAGKFTITEIQRPFVWSKTQVRDIIDSLLRGFPVGYLIAWKNPNIKMKDGSTTSGKL